MTEDDYLVGHVRDALAADPDVRVRAVNGRLVLVGDVPTEARRDEILATARAAAHEVEVVSDLVVRSWSGSLVPEEQL